MRYRTTIVQKGNNTGIPVPEDVLASLGKGRKPPVVVTVCGHTYRSSVATMDGASIVSLSRENRTAAGVSGGDEVDVDLTLDTEPRTVGVPADVATALAQEPATQAAFTKLPYSHQKQHILAIESARAPETRARRIARMLIDLGEGGVHTP